MTRTHSHNNQNFFHFWTHRFRFGFMLDFEVPMSSIAELSFGFFSVRWERLRKPLPSPDLDWKGAP